MKKLALATFTALLLGTAAMATPAEAACWWNGYGWVCHHPHAWGWGRGARWCAWHPGACW